MDFLNEKRFLNIKEVCIYIGLGRTKAREYMNEIGATRKIGSRSLYDKVVIDEVLGSKGGNDGLRIAE